MAALVARAHELDIRSVGPLLRDFVEPLLIGFALFKVGDLELEHVRRPAIAVGVGALEQGFGIGCCWSCRAAVPDETESKTDQGNQDKYAKQASRHGLTPPQSA